ncbi:MAG: pepN [Gammaproteobacteria bacterium]|nr:pepN [Gammaproteobacteria bacterium]
MPSLNEVKYRKDYLPPEYLIDSIELTVEIGEEQTLVSSVLKVRRASKAQSNAPLVLHGEHQELKSISLNDKPLDKSGYRLTATDLTIQQVPAEFNLKIQSVIKPHLNTALEGLYKSQDMFCTQCEPNGFRRITYYLDRPDVMASFTTKIIADKDRYPVLLSNGNKIESGELDNNKHFAVWHDPFKKPSYLFALVAGDLAVLKDHYTTASGKPVALEIYSRKPDIEKCQYAIEALKQAMRWDEDHFGREYDLDVYMIVAVSDFNMGAMENKGLNLFNTKYVLVNPLTSTDMDYQNVQAVIGHEYFHNWTGNRITCRDWFQLSLKEGLTVFRDEEFTSDHHSRTVKRIEDVKVIRSSQFSEDASPMAHPVRPDSYIEMNNFYTVTVYNKGNRPVRWTLANLSSGILKPAPRF